MAKCSAPGKVYLFGEHAVVYGKRAIACAIDLRTTVEITRSGTGIRIHSAFKDDPDKNQYIKTALRKFQRYADVGDATIRVASRIPVASGLGSSAAVTVATLAALNEEYHAGLGLEELAYLGYQTELEVQGAASPTDTYVSALGGTVIVPDRRALPPLACGMVVGHTGIGKSTARMVARVSSLKEKYPELVGGLMDAIGELAASGEKQLLRGDYKAVGELMNINQGLLDALGVSTPELALQVHAARAHGAYGAKITGAGGGGCTVALCDHEKAKEVAAAIGRAWGEGFVTAATAEGARVE